MSKYLQALEETKTQRENFRGGGSKSWGRGWNNTKNNKKQQAAAAAAAAAKATQAAVDKAVKEATEAATKAAMEANEKLAAEKAKLEKKAPTDLELTPAPKAEITDVKDGLAADVSLDPEASKQFTTSEDEVYKISDAPTTLTQDAEDVKVDAVDPATTGFTSIANTQIKDVDAANYTATQTSDVEGSDLSIFGEAPQGVAATVMKTVNVAKPRTAGAAADALASGSGVDAGLSTSIASDPVGALDQIDGADIESRANIAALPEEALMSTQMDGLLEGMEEGKTPLWALPAVNKVNAMLAARGMTASSVGRDALFSAIIQSAMPIAQDNAKALQARAAQTLDAAVQFTKQEADFEQQMKITNLANQQQAFIQSRELSQQRLLSDQNASNASKQFNASNQQQTDQFMTSMRNNVSQFNASQDNALKQFNASEINKINSINAGNQLQADQFNEQMTQDAQKFFESNVLQREQFNASNAQAIQQSDLAWRRNTNSAATAAFNAANQQNVQNEYNMTALDQAQVWLQMRDSMAYVRQNYENEEQRIAQLYATAIGNEAAMGASKSSVTTANQRASADFIDTLFL